MYGASNRWLAYLFWIVPTLRGKIKGHILSGERIDAQNVIGSADYDESTTFSLENRNLHNLPSQLKGCVCAIRDVGSENIDDFKLCFIYKVDYETDVVQYLEWIGRAIKTRGQNEIIAEFQLLNRKNLEVIDDLQWHFKVHTELIKNKDFIFLSKVTGWDFFVDSANPSGTKDCQKSCKKKFLVDNNDGCFYADPGGPDTISLPKSIGEKFHKIGEPPSSDYYVLTCNLKSANLKRPTGPKGCSRYWKYRKQISAVPTYIFKGGYNLEVDPTENSLVRNHYVNVPILTKSCYNHIRSPLFGVEFVAIQVAQLSIFDFKSIVKLGYKEMGEMAETIRQKARQIVDMYYILSFNEKGGRLRVMSEMEHEDYVKINRNYCVEHHHVSGGIIITTESKDVTQYPGSVLSIWRTFDEIGDYSITTGYCKKLYECYGRGHGNRNVSRCCGSFIIHGQRTSSQANISVTEGKGTKDIVQYHRKHYSHAIYQVYIEKMVKLLSKSAEKVGFDDDSNLYKAFLGE